MSLQEKIGTFFSKKKITYQRDFCLLFKDVKDITNPRILVDFNFLFIYFFTFIKNTVILGFSRNYRKQENINCESAVRA